MPYIPSHENPIDREAVARALYDPNSLQPWQRYILSCFPRDDYVPVPDYARYLLTTWRHATWEHFVSDTIHCNGTQMATLLSLAYRPAVVAEFGLDAGLTTLQLCKLNPHARVYGVDLNSRDLTNNLPICFHALMNNVTNLTISIMPSWEFALPGQVDLCFIDACHIGDAPWKDSCRAWENRDVSGDWCIAWDDYHENVPDVKNSVDRFVSEVGMKLQKVGSWFYIGTKNSECLEEFL